MAYTFASITEREELDQTWVPRIVDNFGRVGWLPGDGRVEQFTATGLSVYYGAIEKQRRVLWVSDVDITVHVSRARLVAVCRRYDKGSRWISTSLSTMVVLNAISIASAKLRSHGRFLVGQVWWPWLSSVGYTRKTGWQDSNKLRLIALDGAGGEWVYADFELARREDPRRAAELVLSTAIAARGQHADLRPDDREAVARVRLPHYADRSRRFALATLPGAHRALAATTDPAALSPETLADPGMRAAVTEDLIVSGRRRADAELLLADASGMAVASP
jgi:hypothetical protein